MPQGASVDGNHAYVQFPDGAMGHGEMPPASSTIALLGQMGLQQNYGTYATLDKEQTSAAEQAIKDANGLTKKSDCDQALAKFNIPSLAALVSQLKSGDIFDAQRSTASIPDDNGKLVPAYQYAKTYKEKYGAVVYMGVSGPNGDKNPLFLLNQFFNPPNITHLAIQRAIILIHEAVHKFGNKGDAHFGNSKALSDRIIEKCFPALKGKLGGVG